SWSTVRFLELKPASPLNRKNISKPRREFKSAESDDPSKPYTHISRSLVFLSGASSLSASRTFGTLFSVPLIVRSKSSFLSEDLGQTSQSHGADARFELAADLRLAAGCAKTQALFVTGWVDRFGAPSESRHWRNRSESPLRPA
ncbi:MAG: hypothetical protein WBC90_07665, partial [Albidovulum sp.]